MGYSNAGLRQKSTTPDHRIVRRYALFDRLWARCWLTPLRGAQSLDGLTGAFLGENVEQAFDGAAGITAAVFEMLDLLDGDAEPDGELGLGDLRVDAQLTNVFCVPLHG